MPRLSLYTPGFSVRNHWNALALSRGNLIDHSFPQNHDSRFGVPSVPQPPCSQGLPQVPAQAPQRLQRARGKTASRRWPGSSSPPEMAGTSQDHGNQSTTSSTALSWTNENSPKSYVSTRRPPSGQRPSLVIRSRCGVRTPFSSTVRPETL